MVGGGGVGRGVGSRGGSGGWERRSEAFVKIQKKNFSGGGGGGGGGGMVRVDVNGEVNFCENSKKKIVGGGRVGGRGVRGGGASGWRGSGWMLTEK